MKISGKKEWELAPEGMHQSICVDVVDLGMEESQLYGKSQHKLRIVWEITAKMEDGRPFIVSRKFTASLSEKGNLRPFLETWRGKKFTDEEVKEYDTERLIGANGYMQIMHNTRNDNTYSDVQSVMPWPSQLGPPIKPSGNYKRVQDRIQEQDATKPQQAAQPSAQVSTVVAASGIRPSNQIPDLDEIPF